MRQVWFSSSGRYSSYEVNHIFATEELATQYANDHKRGMDKSFVEGPFEILTELPEPIRQLELHAYIKRDGLRYESESVEVFYEGLDSMGRVVGELHATHFQTSYADKYDPEINLVVQGSDFERVRKVYSEHKRQLIAEFEFYVFRPGLHQLSGETDV